jgi:hypothetical protein
MDQCPERGLIDAHFAGRGARGPEAELREHLFGCQSCRRYYAHCQQLSEFDPGAPTAKQRIGAALGLSAPRQRGVNPWLPGLLAVAVAALLLVVVISIGRWSRPPARTARSGAGAAGFMARGGPKTAKLSPAAPQLQVYLVRGKGRPTAATAQLPARPELAFAYANPGRYRYLLLFGIDEHKQVYWFYPAWQDAKKNPAATPIAAGAEVRELSHAVTHRYRGRRLTLVAVFSNTRSRARDVERQLTARPAGGALWTGPGAVLVRRYRLAAASSATSPPRSRRAP